MLVFKQDCSHPLRGPLESRLYYSYAVCIVIRKKIPAQAFLQNWGWNHKCTLVSARKGKEKAKVITPKGLKQKLSSLGFSLWISHLLLARLVAPFPPPNFGGSIQSRGQATSRQLRPKTHQAYCITIALSSGLVLSNLKQAPWKPGKLDEQPSLTFTPSTKVWANYYCNLFCVGEGTNKFETSWCSSMRNLRLGTCRQAKKLGKPAIDSGHLVMWSHQY